jgi:predicted amidohydrolase YtcJ
MMVRKPARIVFRNTTVYTADRQRPWATALAVDDGRIAWVGDDAQADGWIGAKTELLALPGLLVLPGFRDSHIHPLTGSFNLLECRLTGPADARAYLGQIRTYLAANAGQPFLRGGGWLPDAFGPEGPDRRALDEAVPDRPAILKALDGHSAWVNGRALELAGIGRDTPDPAGGTIVRDRATGEATGTLREWSAMELVEAKLPAPTRRDLVTAGWAFMERASPLGIVSLHEAMAGAAELEAYRTLEQSGDLPLRVSAALLCEPPGGEATVEALCALQRKYEAPLVRPRAAKLFLDGVLEAHTARLLSPYEDRPGFCGESLWEPGDLDRTVQALDRAGFQLHLHATGDAAVRLALDAWERNLKSGGRRDGRPLIAHCDLMDATDIPRFGPLGAAALLQPAWFYAETNFSRTVLPFLGPQRAHSLYRMRSLLEAGAAVACGSDWPFSGELNTFNPLEAIQVGMTRAGLASDPEKSYLPEERVDLASLIDGFTIAGARADFQEGITGSLTVGKSADLVVLDRNLFTMPAQEISRAKVLLTLFEGRAVFRDPALQGGPARPAAAREARRPDNPAQAKTKET